MNDLRKRKSSRRTVLFLTLAVLFCINALLVFPIHILGLDYDYYAIGVGWN